jgi:hypothetical protein
MTPNLLFHPVLHVTEASAGMADPEVVDPPPQYGVDQVDHPIHWLGYKASEDFLDFLK